VPGPALFASSFGEEEQDHGRGKKEGKALKFHRFHYVCFQPGVSGGARCTAARKKKRGAFVKEKKKKT